MYIPCRDVRIDDILEIRRCARKVGKLYNLNTDEEIVNVLFDYYIFTSIYFKLRENIVRKDLLNEKLSNYYNDLLVLYIFVVF